MSAKNVLKVIKDKEIDYVDLRFTDPRGKLQHVTMDTKVVDEDMLNNGVFFDGSSIAGWKAINESDMILKPDLARPIIDPFNSHTTLNIFCDILDAIKKRFKNLEHDIILPLSSGLDSGAIACAFEKLEINNY
mgnify:CR=1 FL=1